MKWFISLLFFCNCYAADPNTILDNVNISTGSINYKQTDLVVDAIEPLIIEHSYQGTEKADVFFPHLKAKIGLSSNNIEFFACEPSGLALYYLWNRSASFDCCPQNIPGLTNTSENNLSARNNPLNNCATFNPGGHSVRVTLPDGGFRAYRLNSDSCTERDLHLTMEVLPNGNQRHYEYDGQRRLARVSTKNCSGAIEYAWAKFSYDGDDVVVDTSDGQQATYHFIKHKHKVFLDTVSIPERPKIQISYHEGKESLLPQEISVDGQPVFHVDYNPGETRISSMELFIEKDKPSVPFRTFSYQDGKTESRDAAGMLTTHHFDKDSRLAKVDNYKENDELFSSQHLTWEGANLKEKALFSASGDCIFSREFSYDDLGNVTEDIFHDDSLDTTYSKSFSYSSDGRNMLLKETEDSGLISTFEYLQGTDLISKKLIAGPEGTFQRYFFVYDDNNLCVAEISDDGDAKGIDDFSGVSERKICRISRSEENFLPITIQELYWDGKEIPLSTRKISYNTENKVVREDVYDSDGIFLYSLHTDYDSRGNISRKTDPLGRESLYEYDDFGRLIFEQKAGKPFSRRYYYDLAGRCIFSEEYDMEGDRRAVSTHYDTQGRPISITDEHGNITENTYDAFGNCIETRAPDILDENGNIYSPVLKNAFDEQGNAIKLYGADNSVVETSFNALGGPITINHPDGTVTRNTYLPNGLREKTITDDGLETRFTYDILQHVIAQETFSPEGICLVRESWEYNTFHMLSHTDIEGQKTVYSYDRAGRKTAEQCGDHRLQFSYDSRGYLLSTFDVSSGITHTQSTDLAGRKTEEWIEQPNGNVEDHTIFHNTYYDKIFRVVRGDAVDEVEYDGRGRKVLHIDPLGAKTTTSYEDNYCNGLGQNVLRTTTTMPNGMSLVETYDTLSRVIKIEKKDLEKQVLHKEELFYDRSSNMAMSVVTIFKDDAPPRTISTCFVYDSMHRLISKTEADQRTTSYSYDSIGREILRKKPDGVEIMSSYDYLGRVTELRSSDGSVQYRYSYDEGMQPTRIEDIVAGTTHHCSYDKEGNLIFEANGCGLVLQWTYDAVGRPLSLKLPDDTLIEYSYEGSHLSEVSRPTYSHRYLSFNEHGHIAEEQLIGDMGAKSTSYDILDRPFLQRSSSHEISQTFNLNGEIETVTSSLIGFKDYEHNLLSFLVKEDEEEYQYDSIGNPAEIPVDDLNQLQREDLSYDLNGNLLTREDLSFSYDALDRLATIAGPNDTITYTYDPFGRMQSKTTSEGVIYFICDHDSEIGAVDAEGTIIQLRVLGDGINSESGAAVALELRGEVYVPVHDLRGNLIALSSLDEKDVVQTYDMNAYGQCDISDPLSPWRFSSKRHEEGGLVCFRHRFYDTTLKRWLTPDPAGNIDGSNRYGYVLSNPVNRLDQWGLYETPICIESPYVGAASFRVTFSFDMSSMMNAGTFEEQVSSLGLVMQHLIVNNDDVHYLRSSATEIAQAKSYELQKFFSAALEFSNEGEILLTSLTNGIGNKPHDFTSSIKSVNNIFHNDVFMMGLFNATEGLKTDLNRVFVEGQGYDTPIVIMMRTEILFNARLCERVGDNTYFLKILHSEAGLIYCNAFNGMTLEQQNLVKKHALVAAFGPAEPVPSSSAYEAINIYSEKDNITGGAGRNKDPNDYDIRFVECISSWSEHNLLGYADHAYLGSTYQEATSDMIKHFDAKYKFYRYNK